MACWSPSPASVASLGAATSIAVAGGTGVLGGHVVGAVRRCGGTPVVIARAKGVDLTTGDGLDHALEGVDAVIDASNVQALRAKTSIAFFDAATGHQLADVLVRTALGDPVGLAPDVGGPEQHQLPDLARRLIAKHGGWRTVFAVPIPGKAGRQIADGGLLPGDGATILDETYDDWLAAGPR